MIDPALIQSQQARLRTRSMGVKLIVVCTLALLMTIPALFVESMVEDRTQRAAEVVDEISSHVGGQQTFLGPTLAIPYTEPVSAPNQAPGHGTYLVFPAQASANVRPPPKSATARSSKSPSSRPTSNSTPPSISPAFPQPSHPATNSTGPAPNSSSASPTPAARSPTPPSPPLAPPRPSSPPPPRKICPQILQQRPQPARQAHPLRGGRRRHRQTRRPVQRHLRAQVLRRPAHRRPRLRQNHPPHRPGRLAQPRLRRRIPPHQPHRRQQRLHRRLVRALHRPRRPC